MKRVDPLEPGGGEVGIGREPVVQLQNDHAVRRVHPGRARGDPLLRLAAPTQGAGVRHGQVGVADLQDIDAISCALVLQSESENDLVRALADTIDDIGPLRL